jgi:hypothetical protein
MLSEGVHSLGKEPPAPLVILVDGIPADREHGREPATGGSRAAGKAIRLTPVEPWIFSVRDAAVRAAGS